MSVSPSTVNPGYFNDSLPTRTPSVSRQHTSLDLNGTLTVEKFVKGGGGARDPRTGEDFVCLSYVASQSFPVRVFRNGVRQAIAEELDCYVNPEDFTWGAKNSVRSWVDVSVSADGKYQTAVTSSAGRIYVSSDYGDTWTEKPISREWTSICMSSDGMYQTAVPTVGSIYRSEDYGDTWSAVPSISDTWSDVAMSADGVYQTATSINGGGIHVSSDRGVTWTAKSVAVAGQNWRVSISADGSRQTLVSVGAQIYVSTDFGSNWTAKDSTRNWNDVCMSSDGKYQAAPVDSSQIYVSTDYGDTWVPRGDNRAWMRICMSSDGRLLTAGVSSGGPLYVSTDYGDTWTAKDSNRVWYGVSMSANGVYQTAVVFGGNLYVMGTRWTDPVYRVGFYKAPLDPGEVVVAEYLTSSTDLIPMP
jgi:hypothetical protein